MAFHAFTGCDFTAAFCGQGKVRPYKKMCAMKQAFNAFCMLGEPSTVPQNTVDALQMYTCSIKI